MNHLATRKRGRHRLEDRLHAHREQHGHDYLPGHRPGHCGATVLDDDGYGRFCGEKP